MSNVKISIEAEGKHWYTVEELVERIRPNMSPNESEFYLLTPDYKNITGLYVIDPYRNLIHLGGLSEDSCLVEFCVIKPEWNYKFKVVKKINNFQISVDQDPKEDEIPF